MAEADAAVVDAARLRAFLDPYVDGIDDDLSISLVSGGRSNPTFRVTDGDRRWILRRQPFGEVLATAHDMGREYRVITALRGSAVPVPETVALCQDPSVIGSPFYVMVDLDGITLRNHADAAALTDDERARIGEQMATILASLHEIAPESVALGDFGRPDGFLERQVRRWRTQWDAAHLVDRPHLDTLLDRLGRSVPTTLSPGILHGDFKLDNVMLDRADPGRIIGVLDWEMSTLGDTMADVGMMMSLWDEPGRPFNPVSAGATANPGFPSRAEVVERYAQIRGIDLPNTDWYVVLAYVKVAVVVEQIHTRHVKGLTLGAGFDDAGAMVDPLLDSAMEIAATTSVSGLRL